MIDADSKGKFHLVPVTICGLRYGEKAGEVERSRRVPLSCQSVMSDMAIYDVVGNMVPASHKRGHLFPRVL